MTVELEAVYENGVFKPKQPVALDDGTPVRLTLHAAEDIEDPLEGVIGKCATGRKDGAANHDKYLYGKRRP
jgi:predicted DNA-binding antitoxin AbrB/MazE fold protein